MKKIISILLILCLALSLCACGEKALDSQPEAEVQAGNEPEEQPGAEMPAETDAPPEKIQTEEIPETPLPEAGLNFASGYEDVYAALEAAAQLDKDESSYYGFREYLVTNEVMDAVPESSAPEYSGTNVQEVGIDEGDLVKTDGEYIYIIRSGCELVILKAQGKDTFVVSLTQLAVGISDGTPLHGVDIRSSVERTATEMFVWGDRLAVVYESSRSYKEYELHSVDVYDFSRRTEIEFYDISKPEKPLLLSALGQDGNAIGTRLYDGKLYVVTSWDDYDKYYGQIRDRSEDLIPALYENQQRNLLRAEDICIGVNSTFKGFIIVACYDMETAACVSAQSILGGGDMVYMSGENIYVAGRVWTSGKAEPRKQDEFVVVDIFPSTNTGIYRFGLGVNGARLDGSAIVPGYLESRFSMNEYECCLRLVTTVSKGGYSIYTNELNNDVEFRINEQESQTNSLYILNGDMEIAGSVENLAEGERVYSARFDGEMAYFCTFKQIDPLFAVDCSDPARPLVLSALKISGFSEYLHNWEENRLFGFGYETEGSAVQIQGLKLVMFDTSNKADVGVENTLLLENVIFSDALYDPHGFFISHEKNIIGFIGDRDYYIFGYSEEEGFYERARIDFQRWGTDVRGMYIGDEIYLIGRHGGFVLDLESCSLIQELSW